MILLAALLQAPLVGVNPDDPFTLHAVKGDDIAKAWGESDVVPAACGANVKLLDYGDEALSWPIPLDHLVTPRPRCRECVSTVGARVDRRWWPRVTKSQSVETNDGDGVTV